MPTRLPRDLSGDDLIKLLRRNYGFEITRQVGSHIRLTLDTEKGKYHLTVPKHRQMRVGTLNSILSDVAKQLKSDKQDVIEELFG